MRKDMVMEICLAAVGIFFGSLVPAISGLVHFNSERGATGADLLSVVLCAAALFVALVTGYQWRVRSKGHVDLETEIRNRPKVPVTHMPAKA